MNELLKLIKMLTKKGFATSAEKAKVQALYKELESDFQETVEEEVVAVEKLPETNPEDQEEIQEAVEKAFKKSAKDVEANLSKKLDDSVAEMKSDIESFLKKQKENGTGAGNSDIIAKRKALNTYLKNFSSAIISGDDTKAKEMTTDKTGSPFAGYAVNSELSAEIRVLTTEYGVARREFFATPLSKNAYEANTLATDVTVGWVNEAGVVLSTEIVLAQTELKLKKLGAIVSLTRELIEDEEVDLFAFIASRVAEGFAKAEDSAFFTGTGGGDTANGGYTGLLNVSAIPTVVLASSLVTSLTVEKLYEAIDKLPESAQPNAKFYMNRVFKSQIRLLKDGSGQYIYQDPINNQGMPTLAGYPVVTVEVMPKTVTTNKGFIIFGDLKKTALLGYKNGLDADRFNAGVIRNVANNADLNLITTDREAIRWISRVGYIALMPTASIIIKTL